MTSTPTQQQIDEYEAAITAYQQHPNIGFACCSAHPAADAAAALLTEARRLRARVAGLEGRASGPNTLPAWLHWRFGPHGQPWSDVPAEDQALWEHQARAVRRAVARGGFKPSPAAAPAGDGQQQ